MNYAEIVAAGKAYADRQDIEVDANMDTFIIMVESRVNRLLKTREQSHRIYTPTIAGVEWYPLPQDYNGMRDFKVNSANPLEEHSVASYEYLSPEQFTNIRDSAYGGRNFYTVIANQLQVYPIMDDGLTLEMVYYRKVINLNPTTTFNWLSESYPDIYIAGLISEIESFAKNYDAAKLWDAKVSRSIGELEVSDTGERWAGSSLTTKVTK